jgi:hypothetical protein
MPDEIRSRRVTRNRRTRALVVVMGMLAIAGCAPAATTAAGAAKTTAAGRTSTTPAGGMVHIITYSINSDGPYFRVLLTGAIGDYGPAVTVHPDGTVDPEHTGDLELKLTHGSFRLGIAGIDKKVIDAYRHWPDNPRTCSGSISFTAAAPVVAGSGTGLYQGIGGSFSLAVTIEEVDVKPVCNGTSRFLSQVILMTGAGTVTF